MIFLCKQDSERFNNYLYSFYKGIRKADFDAITKNTIIPYFRDHLFLNGLMLFDKTDFVFVVSSGIDLFLYPFFNKLSIPSKNVYCNKLEFDKNDVCTGKILGRIVDGDYKAVCVDNIKLILKTKYPNSALFYYIYGNSKWDIPMLKLANKAIYVNPKKSALKLVAKNIQDPIFQKWDICPLGHSPVWYFINKSIIGKFLTKKINGKKIESDLNNDGSIGLILVNHQSYLDHFCIVQTANHNNYCFIAKSEHYKSGFAKWYHCLTRSIPIDRTNHLLADRSLNIAKIAIQLGLNVIIYPEGTRTLDGKLQPFKPGFVKILGKFDEPLPVTCVTINNSFKLLPKGKFLFNPFKSKISLTIHDTIYFPPNIEQQAVIDKCYEIIKDGLKE